MNYEEAKKLVKNRVGLRCKQKKDGTIIIYGNAWTMLVDLIKKIKN